MPAAGVFKAFCESDIGSSAGKSTKGSIKAVASLDQRGEVWRKMRRDQRRADRHGRYTLGGSNFLPLAQHFSFAARAASRATNIGGVSRNASSWISCRF